MFHTKGVLLCLDFEKAVDTVDWDFMLKVLQKYEFGTNFIRWIQILYKDPKLVIKNNGWLSKEEKLKGIRQGCSISALLFILEIGRASCRERV